MSSLCVSVLDCNFGFSRFGWDLGPDCIASVPDHRLFHYENLPMQSKYRIFSEGKIETFIGNIFILLILPNPSLGPPKCNEFLSSKKNLFALIDEKMHGFHGNR